MWRHLLHGPCLPDVHFVNYSRPLTMLFSWWNPLIHRWSRHTIASTAYTSIPSSRQYSSSLSFCSISSAFLSAQFFPIAPPVSLSDGGGEYDWYSIIITHTTSSSHSYSLLSLLSHYISLDLLLGGGGGGGDQLVVCLIYSFIFHNS